MSTAKQRLLDRIEAKEAVVGVVGLGYVGLPLVVEFAENGLHVIGVDVVEEKIDCINTGRSYIEDVPDTRLRPLVEAGKVKATTAYTDLANVDAIIICVPTPLRKTKDPDMSFVIEAVKQIAEVTHAGALVTLESTTYPGTTKELLQPQLEARGFTVGEDVFVAFSPERIDPGNKTYTVHNTPKVIGGVTDNCTEVATALYSTSIESVVPVSSPTAAEMVKLLENTFRAVNIGLVNEMALMCDKLGIDVWEVINAAASKPFGFMPFYPGPGLGGHCIPVDPHYLSWKLKTLNYTARFIELASEINTSMPIYVVDKVIHGLNTHRKAVNGSRVLVLGVAYKRDVDDVRESPALDVIELLRERGADVVYHDPFVPRIRLTGGVTMEGVALTDEHLTSADCVIIITDHTVFDWQRVVDCSQLIVDSRHATRNHTGKAQVISL